MRSGVCAKCRQSEVYELPLRRYDGTGLPLTSFRSANTTVYVCAGCGYTETYVDADSLALVRKHAKRVTGIHGR